MLPEKAVLTTKECYAYCGSEAIFEELEALYGDGLLKPFRTLNNNSRAWSTNVVKAVLIAAQRDGTLNDRNKVERAVERLRETKRRNALKGREEHSSCAG